MAKVENHKSPTTFDAGRAKNLVIGVLFAIVAGLCAAQSAHPPRPTNPSDVPLASMPRGPVYVGAR
jgi:hypothetical protein